MWMVVSVHRLGAKCRLGRSIPMVHRWRFWTPPTVYEWRSWCGWNLGAVGDGLCVPGISQHRVAGLPPPDVRCQ